MHMRMQIKRKRKTAHAKRMRRPEKPRGFPATSAPQNALASFADVCETADTKPDEVVPSMAEDFATRVRRAREMRELSQAELSGISEINPTTIYRIEAGRSRAHSSTAQKLAKALKVDAQWLLTGDESRAPKPGPSARRATQGGAASHISVRERVAAVEPLELNAEHAVPIAMWNMLAAQALSIGPVTAEETEYLFRQATQESLDADKLEARLWMFRVSESNNDPKVVEAFHAALERQAAEQRAKLRARDGSTEREKPAPNQLKKSKTRK